LRDLPIGPNAVKVAAKDAKFHAPVVDPRKIVCIGLNYKDHAAESGAPIPKDPVLFSKYATALIGHGETIVLPKVSSEVDYRGGIRHRRRQEGTPTHAAKRHGPCRRLFGRP
jgi:2-keto-4-pentenoate hydratase/2-oxohepta-3-ene-1,7-dioic acid hydratase in catechol pathway